jgi:hypothetical protein
LFYWVYLDSQVFFFSIFNWGSNKAILEVLRRFLNQNMNMKWKINLINLQMCRWKRRGCVGDIPTYRLILINNTPFSLSSISLFYFTHVPVTTSNIGTKWKKTTILRDKLWYSSNIFQDYIFSGFKWKNRFNLNNLHLPSFLYI